MELNGIPWNAMETPWVLHANSVEFHGFPWILVKYGKIIFNSLFQKKRVFQKN